MKRMISMLLVCAMVLAVFVGCTDRKNTVDSSSASDSDSCSGVNIHTKEQNKFLRGGDYAKATDYAVGDAEKSRPEPITLEWDEDVNGEKPDSYILAVSEKKNMSDARKYETKDCRYQITNLKTGTTYYWTVTSVCGGETRTSEVKKFSTLTDDPRNLYVDGITNARDIGGWPTESGGEVKQGLIFRCGALNHSDGSDRITDAGRKVMTEELGIKSEIDLRLVDGGENGGITESPLGKGVKYYSCPMDANIDMMFGNKEMIKKVFGLFADEANYPIVFHCAIGTDRTGCIAFLLNGLLGVAEDDLYYDYMFSNYGHIGGSRDPFAIQLYLMGLEKYKGEHLSDRVRAYLIDIGVTEEKIDFIVKKMTGK